MTARLTSLLDQLADLRDRLSPPALIALDFDGTLTEIVDDPSAPRLTVERREVLERVSASGRRLAVISGRSVSDVRERVGIGDAIYVGNHGLEIEGPSICERPVDADQLAARVRRVMEALPSIDGAVFEDKGLTATVHVRPREDEERIAAVGTELRSIVEREGLVLRRGKASWEIRPSGPRTKGEALRRLIELVPNARADRTLYVGDDTTDEDAFRAIPEGVTARVGEAEAETGARYFLPTAAHLYTFLDRLTEDRITLR